MEKVKTVTFSSNICLYCGEEMSQQWDDHTPYYECDCPDAVKKRKILEEIEKLKYQIPREKFEIREEQALYKK